MIYDSADIYISTATSLQEKITKIDEVINALLDVGLKAAATGNFEEYSLNNGQTTIRTRYRDAAAVSSSIIAFERIKNIYINQLNGRGMRLLDEDNF